MTCEAAVKDGQQSQVALGKALNWVTSYYYFTYLSANMHASDDNKPTHSNMGMQPYYKHPSSERSNGDKHAKVQHVTNKYPSTSRHAQRHNMVILHKRYVG